MSKAEELLNSLAVEEETGYYAGMGDRERHIIIGRDRFIFVPECLRKIGVESDHDVETVTFDCPRYWDKLDLSKMQIYVNYMRPDGYKDKDACTNVVIDEEDDTIIHFDWDISSKATEIRGTLSFLVNIRKTDGKGNIKHSWHSELNTDMYISAGMECDESVLTEYPDIITYLLERMDTVESCAVVVTGEQILALRNKIAAEKANIQVEIATERSRIDNLAKLKDGSTTGDAELIDGRTDYTGKTWDNIGAHVRGVARQLSDEIDILNEGIFAVIQQSVKSGDYNNNSYRIKFPNAVNKGTKIVIKIIAKSYGYIRVETNNGSESTGLTSGDIIVNIGDVRIIEGVVYNRTNNLYVYSANNIDCDIFVYVERKTEIVVSKDGLGDYMTLDEALQNAKDGPEFPIVIRVRAGVYEMRTETPDEVPYKKNNRYLTIVGEDRNNCIIRNDNGYYSPHTEDSNGLLFDSSPLRLSGNVTIENLTIISTDKNYNHFVENESRVQGVKRAQSYCIHSDFDCDENTTTLIRNCKLVNDHYCCIGCGTRKNHVIQVENCELETTVNSEHADNGAIFMHSYNLNSGNAYEGQEAVLKNNVIVNTNGTKSCYLYASSPDRIYATLIGNVSKTANTQNGFESFGNAYGVTKTELCFGNNIATMNY